MAFRDSFEFVQDFSRKVIHHMRKITAPQSLCFAVLFISAIALGIYSAALLLGKVRLGDFRGVTLISASIIFVYVFSIIIYRAFIKILPLRNGSIEKGSSAEFGYHVYLLFYLILFQPLTRSLVIPVPLMRTIYLALGARFGENTYSAGTILDPPLTRIGDNCIVGHDAVLFSHAVEGESLSLAEIWIGNNVTIGAKAVIQPGVVIEDDAIIAVSAVVSKGTRVGRGELWGGVPARRIRMALHERMAP